MQEQKYKVSGMSCSACSARVEKAVGSLSGVDSCAVNLLTGALTVEGDVANEAIISAVEKAGYGIKLDDGSMAEDTSAKKQSGAEKAENTLIARLVWSVVLLVALMYVSMGYVMWSFPLPRALTENQISIAVMQLVLSAIIMVINQKFFINGFKGIANGAPNMDTLVALGSAAAFIYSLAYTVIMPNGEHLLHELYFESAAMILTLITVGKWLEARAKGKTTDALEALMKLSPKTATVIKESKEISVKVEDVKKGDIFLVKPAEAIAVDGKIIDGHTSVDESALTGESVPVEKEIGAAVSAGTMNLTGAFKAKATNVGEDTTISKIIKMVSDASSSKAPIAKIADKVSGVFVPIIIVIAIIATAAWLILGHSIGFSLARGISVLVISCPCALGLATPVAIMVGTGRGARSGLLFKTATSLEVTGKCDCVVLDKTGTITSGKMSVSDIIGDDDLLQIAYSLEKNSEHPIGKAICEKANESGTKLIDSTDFEIFAGGGLTAIIGGEKVFGGNLKFMADKCVINDEVKNAITSLSNEGKTPVLFSKNGKYIGTIAVSDTIKEDSKKAIENLKSMGKRVIMLTGDNDITAKAIASSVGVDDVISGVMPSGKESAIRDLQNSGKVIMVGDGINDAPALTRADIGIAIGAGTDIAIDSADVVLSKGGLSGVVEAINLSRKTLKIIHENLFWAFFYNALGIPLAAGVFIPFGITLNPMFGALAMSLSSFCVVMNALRLRNIKL